MTQAIRDISSIFERIGFSVASGPELETEFYNFDALNIPADHPARDMQDTFWIKPRTDADLNADQRRQKQERLVLRTHTTSVQVRVIEKMKDNPRPLKIIVPGKVYRNEATDTTHEAQFYQLDGVYLNKSVSMAELKGTFEYFFREFIGPEAKVRFRPSYFGFVEPGVEVDVWWTPLAGGPGRWLELFGAGLIHPNVIKATGLNPEEWKGFAFGGGIDRLIMLRYGIDDIRHLYSGDIRLINQF
ncbi:MAG: phenylalanine--tRNA ligase subunit alpha [Candidatus Colwellbacteria bacterium RIFCSPLOWO2_01_FULL_48_10]|uniref:phenylalanine--tRNA ligase n=1 Tax=Candidatus Colwellbacteria bacterium RIFCSPLOWO2_01_FULL_48_10 TaxID=1797690 RepID=A0A1G1Z4A8_9BACT|nr:MAG: phenylalanine--tRNA ligase subunit alpha [Candidatus Colwellbacteria bacterium RIFCSPLOWO2_01_FULL_48_10]